jgi:hypothetical protein
MAIRARNLLSLAAKLAQHWRCAIAILMAIHSYGMCFGGELAVSSANGQYRLTAKWPHPLSLPIEGDFVYKLYDAKLRRDLWTRKSPEDKPADLGDPGKPLFIRVWKERSPISLHVNDDGCSVLWLADDKLIAVRRDGKETGKLDILHAFPQGDSHYIEFALDAGYLWGRKRSHFATDQGKSYFVVRTWWGRRVILDLESGRAAADAGSLAKQLDEADREFVRTTLDAAVKDYRKSPNGDEVASAAARMAIYMAGQLHMKECVPALRSLEDVPYSGTLAISGDDNENRESQPDFTCWEEFTVRRVVQLSLRRLDQVPRYFPLTQFRVYSKDYSKRKPFMPALDKSRIEQAAAVRKGMQPIEVLRLVGAPDFNCGLLWEYDMDDRSPYTLIIEWDKMRVISVERKSPATWKDGESRDLEIMR